MSEKLYLKTAFEEVQPNLAQSTMYKYTHLFVETMGGEVEIKGSADKRPRRYVEGDKDCAILRGWAKSQLAGFQPKPKGNRKKKDKQLPAPAVSGTLMPATNEPEALNVRPNMAGLKRMINTMRKAGYTIDCKVTAPSEEI